MTIVDDADNRRFLLEPVDAQLDYHVDGNRLVLVSTWVPEAVRGRGIGGRLVHAAVERAAARGETVVPRCSFARSWLEDHPEVAATVAIDWSDQPA